MPAKSRRTSCAPFVAAAAFEALEGRELMSAGALDPSFADHGKLVSPALPFRPSEIAMQKDGKTIAVGTLNFSFAVARLNTNGSIDRTFAANSNGIAIADFGADRGEEAFDVAVQPDGKVVVVGATSYSTIVGSQDKGNMAIARFNSNGTLDRSFDGNGMRTIDYHSIINGWGGDAAYAVAIQPDGKILVGGSAGHGNSLFDDDDFAVARMNPSGSMDGSFGDEGQMRFDMGFESEVVNSMALQSDGKIALGGTLGFDFGQGTSFQMGVGRLTSTGGMDKGFAGGAGLSTTRFVGVGNSFVTKVVLGLNDSILAVGAAGGDFAMARFTRTGQLDPTFGAAHSGKVTTDFGATKEHARTAMITPDNQILVGGVTDGNFAIARYDYAGAIDTSFGTNGKVNTGFGGTESVYQLRTQADGKIVATGASGSKVMASRYLPTAPKVGLTSSHTTTDEGRTDASFTFYRDQVLGFPTRVYYSIAGTATLGADYSGPTLTQPPAQSAGFVVGGVVPGTVFNSIAYVDIPAGQSQVIVPIRAVFDGKAEPAETVIATLRANASYVLEHNTTKTLTIVDRPGSQMVRRAVVRPPTLAVFFSDEKIVV